MKYWLRNNFSRETRSIATFFGICLVVTLAGGVGLYLRSTMSSEEQFLAAHLGNKLPPIIRSVSCGEQSDDGRECRVTFATDMKIVPTQVVKIPPTSTGYPRARFTLEHDAAVTGPHQFVESNVRVLTTIDTDRVDSKDAIAWIDSLQSAAVTAASTQAQTWLENEEKAHSAAASYH